MCIYLIYLYIHTSHYITRPHYLLLSTTSLGKLSGSALSSMLETFNNFQNFSKKTFNILNGLILKFSVILILKLTCRKKKETKLSNFAQFKITMIVMKITFQAISVHYYCNCYLNNLSVNLCAQSRW